MGAKLYFTGEPCRNGHLAQRRVASRSCMKCEVDAARRWQMAHPERTAENTRAWSAANRDRINAAQRAAYRQDPKKFAERIDRHRQKHPEKVAARHRRWALDHPEEMRAYKAKSKKKNPDAVRAATRNRRARLSGAPGSHSAADVSDILRAQHERCGYCRVVLRGKYHVDHIIAVASGGSNDRRNLQILCGPCNCAKGARDPIAFAQAGGRLL